MEREDLTDARVGDGEHHYSVRLVGAVSITGVGHRGGLPVGVRRQHEPITGRSQNPGAEIGHAGLTTGEPGLEGRRLQGGIPAQQPFQGRRVGVLERRDVLVEQRTGSLLGGLGDRVRRGGQVPEPGTGALQRALDRRCGGAEDDGDLGGREGQHLPQNEHGPLRAGQVLQAGDQRQPQVLAREDDRGRVGRVRADEHVRNRLKPADSRSGRYRDGFGVGFRTAEAGRQHTSAVMRQRGQAGVGGDLVEPGTHR